MCSHVCSRWYKLFRRVIADSGQYLLSLCKHMLLFCVRPSDYMCIVVGYEVGVLTVTPVVIGAVGGILTFYDFCVLIASNNIGIAAHLNVVLSRRTWFSLSPLGAVIWLAPTCSNSLMKVTRYGGWRRRA